MPFETITIEEKNSSLAKDSAYSKLSEYIFLLCIVSLSSFLCFYGLLPFHNITGDDAIYLGVMKKFLASGSYEFNYRPQAKFPPGFPLFLGIFEYYNLPISPLASYFMISFWISSILLAYKIISARTPRIVALSIVALVITSPQLYRHATNLITSDIPYMFFSFLTLVSIAAFEKARTYSAKLTGSIIITLLLTYTISIRTVGVTLAGAIFFWSASNLLKKHRFSAERVLLVVLPLLVSILAYWTWMNWQRETFSEWWIGEFYHSYSRQFALVDPHEPDLGRADTLDYVVRVLSNMIVQGSRLAEVIFRVQWVAPVWFSPLVTLPVFLVAVGIFRGIHFNNDLIAWYTLGYSCAILLWPFDEQTRFILPITPFLIYFAWSGLRYVFLPFIAFCKRRPFALFLIVTLIFSFATIWLYIKSQLIGAQTFLSLGVLFTCVLMTCAMTGSPPLRQFLLTKLENRRFSSLLLRKSMASLVIAMSVTGSFLQLKVANTNRTTPAEKAGNVKTIALAKWVNERAAPNHVVMAAAAGVQPLLHYLTERKVVALPPTSKTLVVHEAISRNNVCFLVISKNEQNSYMRPSDFEVYRNLVALDPSIIRKVHDLDGFLLAETQHC